MNNMSNDVTFVINVHERLVRDFPLTPYILWCQHVHKLDLTPNEKRDFILAWDLKPQSYDNPQLFRYDWQAFKFLSKFSEGGKPSSGDIDQAYRKFRVSEERCALLNEQWAVSIPPRTAELLHGMQNIIANVLGPVEKLYEWIAAQSVPSPAYKHDRFSGRYGADKDDFANYGSSSCFPNFGPGVSVGPCGSKITTISEKLVLGTVTPHSAKFAKCVTDQWSGAFGTPFGVRGSVLTFVPKRVGEARAICYEPSTNMLVQKLIGQYIKKRLKAALGIDLSDQERNRSLAELGSLCDSYCTVDLSSASDLNAYQLVLNTLPFDWFLVLDAIRCHDYWDPIAKTWKEFSKFSTMGNGFTFELETLLFASIVKSAIDKNQEFPISWREISVYGDDIIFPKEHFICVTQALLSVGHIPNNEKSFSSGPFRESCGGDFFHGWNVTPFKIKELTLDDPLTVVNLYNGLFISARQDPNLLSVSDRFGRALLFIKNWIFKHYPRVSEGPIEYGIYSRTMRVFEYQPSNRFLWDTKPRIRCHFSPLLQNFQPVWLLIPHEPRVRRKVGNDVVGCNYDLHPSTVLYFIDKGTNRDLLLDKTYKIKRNRDAFHSGSFRRKGKETEKKASHLACKSTPLATL